MLTATLLAAAVAAASAHGAGASRTTPEPYLAIRTGLKCSACHVNRTGGGGRSAFGAIFAQTQLPAKTGAVKNRALNDFLSLGWDIRALASGTLANTMPRTDIEVSEANAYVEARMIQNVLDVYVDETLGPGAAGTREVFALVDALPLNGYVKAGKFMLPYGLRLQDDYEFIRQSSIQGAPKHTE